MSLQVVDASRIYPATPWMLEHVETGAPIALFYRRPEADAVAAVWNHYAARIPKPPTSPEGT